MIKLKAKVVIDFKVCVFTKPKDYEAHMTRYEYRQTDTVNNLKKKSYNSI